MRFSRKPRRTVVGLLSLSGQASAVALSDFTPKATNLPAQCNTIYTQEIPGCTFDDFQKAVCSKACLEGLVEMNALVSNNCQAADVAETSIVGLFKIGKAIQVLCNVAVVTTTTGLGLSTTIPLMSMPTSQSISSTQTTLLSTTKATTTSATSLTATSSATPAPSTKQSTTSSTTTQPAPTPPTSSIVSTPPPPTTAVTSPAESSPASKTSTSPAEAESIRSGNTNSGGGSPFDNINNSGAASMRNFAQLGCGLLASLALGSYLALA
ncbi:hypothetical protein EG328_001763 [Venturia inaequalis]|uniref:Extracellular membrane protein CFEM domain-containing protein n=1 Tax=Venturia inaequalis TaxID=5025 RepID=A0A8H3UYB1_VENIN|nr:hypothetical protein EG328_001763 [Venturia inaequalis]